MELVRTYFLINERISILEKHILIETLKLHRLIKNGQLMFQGKPHEVINQKTLKEVYDYDLNVIKNNEELFVLNYQ